MQMIIFYLIGFFLILSLSLTQTKAKENKTISSIILSDQVESDYVCPNNQDFSFTGLRQLREENRSYNNYDYGDDDFDNADVEEKEDKNEIAVTLRLYGNTVMGYYYVTLFFGSQLQRQNLIVDTGSTITTIPCTDCGSECGKRHFNQPFDPVMSKTHEEFKCNERFSNYICNDCDNKCPFQIGYTEGSSYQGHFTKDYIVFGNEIEDYYFKNGFSKQKFLENSHLRGYQNPNNQSNSFQSLSQEEIVLQSIIDRRKLFMPFGCTVKETKLFYYQEADGILGLGVYTNGQKLPPNLVDVVGATKPGAFNAFSICYADEGGLFTIGGYNVSHHDKTDLIKYVPFYTDNGQYRVHLNRIEFEGTDLGISERALNHGQGAFFDSGTTLAYAPSYTVSAIKNSLNTFCDQSSENCGGNRRKGACWLYNPDINPTIEDFYTSFGVFGFYFGEEEDYKYEWRAQDYLYQETAGSRWFCFGLEVFEDRTILGGTFMKNHDIMFDKREKRIGFVKANCSISIPEWIVTKPGDTSKNFENVLIFIMILGVAMIVYGLLRLNRNWNERRKSASDFGECPPQKDTTNLTCENEQEENHENDPQILLSVAEEEKISSLFELSHPQNSETKVLNKAPASEL